MTEAIVVIVLLFACTWLVGSNINISNNVFIDHDYKCEKYKSKDCKKIPSHIKYKKTVSNIFFFI